MKERYLVADSNKLQYYIVSRCSSGNVSSSNSSYFRLDSTPWFHKYDDPVDWSCVCSALPLQS